MLVVTFYLLVFSSLIADGKTESVSSTLAKRLQQANRPFSTLSVSYDVEESRDNGHRWELVEKVRLLWDVENRKYHFVRDKMKPNKNETYAREYYCDEGKWTIVFAGRDVKSTSITITDAGLVPFYFPFSYCCKFDSYLLNKFDNSVLFSDVRNIGDMNVKGEDSDTITIVRLTESKKKGVYSEDAFTFQKATGLLAKKVTNVVNEKGVELSKLNEYAVPKGEYYNVNESFFPKCIIFKQYDRASKSSMLVKFTFSKDIKINEKIPQHKFRPTLPIGSHVLNTFENRTYIVTEKTDLTEEEIMGKQLDELFERATK
jgi:hypothetical protein